MLDMVPIVITDLDGTLLDHSSYDFAPALPALRLLRDRGIPLVLCTSKTRAESEWWQRRLDMQGPLIVENGGALLLPERNIVFGSPIADLRAALRRASASAACPVRGFGDMTVKEIARRCDLPEEHARLAALREFDEPFLLLDPERAPALERAIAAEGFASTRGGRFHHILGANDKATAVRALLELHPASDSLGLGDGLNDAGFLNAVDQAVLLPSPSLPQLLRLVPRASVAPAPGPEGWAAAVLSFLRQR
jgi:mannosyl-3-phosphoglycerate phosphatase